MRDLVVLVLPTSSYQADDFLAAAARLGVRVRVASDRCHKLAEEWTEGAIPLELRDPDAAAAELARVLQLAPPADPPAAIVGIDDQSALVAALAAARLGLPHNPPAATAAARNKAQSRAALRAAGVPVPRFERVPRDLAGAALDALCARTPFPCVVKPLVLSGSRGVIRADDALSLRAALERVARLLRKPTVAMRRDPDLDDLLIEEFLPGPEVALEGLLQGGDLRVLALFDKPDPLDGPFFEETLYVTPSRHPSGLQDAIAAQVAAAARALDLREGPVHAELRLTPAGPRVLEVAARSIGGLCARALRFGVGVTLEELVLRHALSRGAPLALPTREQFASGVLMLPIRRGGVLEEVRGVDEARAVPGIEDVIMTAHLREELVPLPEGSSYLGFAFARAPTPEAVEAALRRAGGCITTVVTPRLPVV